MYLLDSTSLSPPPLPFFLSSFLAFTSMFIRFLGRHRRRRCVAEAAACFPLPPSSTLVLFVLLFLTLSSSSTAPRRLRHASCDVGHPLDDSFSSPPLLCSSPAFSSPACTRAYREEGGEQRPSIFSAFFSSPITFAAAENTGPRCIQLNEVRMSAALYNGLTDAGFGSGSRPFCGPGAPDSLYCRCDALTTCRRKNDPYGRNVGECGCCSAWAIIVLFMFVAALTTMGGMALLLAYPPSQSRMWWLFGYPPRLLFTHVKLPQPPASPPGVPFSRSVFSLSNPNHFVDVTEENADLDASIRAPPPVPSARAAETVAHASRTNSRPSADNNGATHNDRQAPPRPPPSTAYNPFLSQSAPLTNTISDTLGEQQREQQRERQWQQEAQSQQATQPQQSVGNPFAGWVRRTRSANESGSGPPSTTQADARLARRRSRL